METPYGEIPENLVKDMTVQEMHDYLQTRYRRRSLLKGAGVLGLAAAAGPFFWRQSSASASTVSAPQWIAYGGDPTREIYVSWSAGAAGGPLPAVPAPQVRWGLDRGYGRIEHAAFSGTVPVPAISGEPAEDTVYSNALLTNLFPNTTYHYSVSNDGVNWSPDVTFTTATPGLSDFRFTMVGDEATFDTSSLPVAQVIAALRPKFNVT
jgi:phosphodiesterase/alkaline phosphatase D-like protein